MVEAQAAPVATGALARAAGLHENTVRGHLEHLLADGYVIREREAVDGRGRPAWLWQAVLPEPASPYAALAGVLAGTLARTSADPVADAREAGRGWGRQIGAGIAPAADHAQARTQVVAVMRDQGFAPHDGEDAVTLHRCPLIAAAVRHPQIVCAVHVGMVDGLLEAIGSDAAADLVPFTAPGECALHVRAASTVHAEVTPG